MELNKNSKWIKFYLKFNNWYPTNFCDYFWGSLKSILIVLRLLTIGILILSCLLSPIMLFWENFDQKSILSDFQIFGMFFWFAGIVGFIIYKIIDYYDNKRYEYKPYKESIIKTWYKDFKNKHCTLITWKDEK